MNRRLAGTGTWVDWDGGRGPQPHTPPHVPSAQLHNAQCTVAHHTKVTISPHHPHPHPHPHPPQPVRHKRATDRSVRVSQVGLLGPASSSSCRRRSRSFYACIHVLITITYPVGTSPRNAPLQMTTSTWAQLTCALRKIIHLHCTYLTCTSYMYLLLYCLTLSVHSTTYSLVLHLSR